MQEKIYNEIAYWELFPNDDMHNLSKDEKIELSIEMLKQYLEPLRKAELTGIIRDEKIEIKHAEKLNKYLNDVLEKLKAVNRNYDEKRIKPLKELPSRGLKKLVIDFTEKAISQGIITEVLEETKKNKLISEKIIPMIEIEYSLSIPNKRSIHQYFRKGDIMLKQKNGILNVVDTYPRRLL